MNAIDPYGLSSMAIQYYANFLLFNPKSEAQLEDLKRAGNDLKDFVENMQDIALLMMAYDSPLLMEYLMAKKKDEDETSDCPKDEDLSDDIAEHAKKHNPRIPTDELSELIKDTITRGEKRDLERGRRAYRDPLTGRVVIVDPSSPDKGTSFIPESPGYFDGLK